MFATPSCIINVNRHTMGCIQSCNTAATDIEEHLLATPRPLAYTKEMLSESERNAMMLACGELGPDPASKFFVERKKCIGFMVHLQDPSSPHGQWFQVNIDHVTQNAAYNDFSGGFRRHYRMLPCSFIECPATLKVLDEFKSTFDIPSGELILVQVQSSHIDVSSSLPNSDIQRTNSFNVHVNPPSPIGGDLVHTNTKNRIFFLQ